MSKGAHDNAIIVPRQDTPEIFEGLSRAQNDLRILKVAAMATELGHAYLEGGTRAQGRFTEQQHQGLAGQERCGLTTPVTLFEIQRQGEHLLEFFRRYIRQRQQVAFHRFIPLQKWYLKLPEAHTPPAA